MIQLTLDGWYPIATADKSPGTAVWVEVELPDHTVVRAHYAYGDGDGLMPPFEGWFTKHPGSTDYFPIPDPIAWRPCRPSTCTTKSP